MYDLQVWKHNEIEVSTAMSRYLYLLNTHLYTNVSMSALKKRVREVFFEMTAESRNIEINTIAYILDEENICIITDFLNSYGHNEEEIDGVLGHYYHDFSCMMDIYVSDTLKEMGFYHAGNPFHFLEAREVLINELFNPEQNMIFPELIPGRRNLIG